MVAKRRPCAKFSRSVAASWPGLTRLWPLVFDICGSADAEDDNGTSASASAVESGNKLGHVGRRITKAGTPSELVEYLLQLGAPRDDDPSVDGTEVEQQTEVVQIAIVKWILVVPFHFERHPVLVAVHLVGRRNMLVAVHHNLGVEFLFDPTELGEMRVELACNESLRAAWLHH